MCVWQVRIDVENALLAESKGEKVSSGNQKLIEVVKAIALCHNVTPVTEDDSDSSGSSSNGKVNNGIDVDVPTSPRVSYQASSPDEVCANVLYSSGCLEVARYNLLSDRSCQVDGTSRPLFDPQRHRQDEAAMQRQDDGVQNPRDFPFHFRN